MIDQFFAMAIHRVGNAGGAIYDLGRDGNPAIPWIVYGRVALISALGLWIIRRPLGVVRGDPGKPAIGTVETTDGG